jgi:hypothetical protein
MSHGIRPIPTPAAPLVALLAALGLACAGTSGAPDDAEISERVELALEQDDFTEEHEIRVETEDGVVSLLGQVTAPIEEERGVALARAVEGVEAVDSRLTVVPTDPDRLPAVDDLPAVP